MTMKALLFALRCDDGGLPEACLLSGPVTFVLRLYLRLLCVDLASLELQSVRRRLVVVDFLCVTLLLLLTMPTGFCLREDDLRPIGLSPSSSSSEVTSSAYVSKS